MPQLVRAKVGVLKKSASVKSAPNATAGDGPVLPSAVPVVAGPPQTVNEAAFEPAGCGLLLERVDTGDVLVKVVVPGGAAKQDGRVLRGDQLTHVDRSAVSELHLEEILDKIKGREGTPVLLTVARADGVVDIELIRKRIAGKAVAPPLTSVPEVDLQQSASQHSPPRTNDGELPLKTTIPLPEAEHVYPNARMPVRARSGLKNWINGEAQHAEMGARAHFQSAFHKIENRAGSISDVVKIALMRKQNDRRKELAIYKIYASRKSMELSVDAEDNAPLRPAPRHQEFRMYRNPRVCELLTIASDSSDDDATSDEDEEGRGTAVRRRRTAEVRTQVQFAMPQRPFLDRFEGRARIAAARGHTTSATITAAVPPKGHGLRGGKMLPDPDEETSLFVQLHEVLRTATAVEAEWLNYDPTSNSWETKPISVWKAFLDTAHVPSHLSVRESNTNRPPLLLRISGSSAEVRAAKCKAKTSAIASFFGSMFNNAISKECSPRFLPSYAMRLLDEGESYLHALPYLDSASVRLGHDIPQDASEEHVGEVFRFAAFQFFVYKLSDKSIVFPDCTLVAHFWSEFSVASSSGQVGGTFDQGDAALRGWETSFAATYGPLLGLEAETLLDKSVETVLDLMSEKGILRPASARKISDFQRVCATGKWTCAAAVGGDVSFGRSDCMWPLTGAKPSPEPRQPIHAGSGGGVYQPRQAKNQHTLLAGVHQGNSPQQKHSTLRPAELDDERMSLLEGLPILASGLHSQTIKHRAAFVTPHRPGTAHRHASQAPSHSATPKSVQHKINLPLPDSSPIANTGSSPYALRMPHGAMGDLTPRAGGGFSGMLPAVDPPTLR